MSFAKRRPVWFSGKAIVLWEVTGTSTTGAAGVWVWPRGERFAEIASGRANFQQGFATTFKDSWYKGKPRPREDFGLAHGSESAMRERVMHSYVTYEVALQRVTPQAGEGALGKW
jgi:hypothetical protein